MALRLGPALLISISFAAIMVGILLHAISINDLQYRSPPATHFDRGVIIDDKPTDLVWFLQITDLHLSNRGPKSREIDLNDFAHNYVDIIKPDVVLVTGDITDGRLPNTTFGTGPQLDEWLAYNGAVTRSGALNKTVWLDIRGNHDNFNVYRPKDPRTLYRKFSIKGKEFARNYMQILQKGGKNYTFIAVDEVQTPGLKIPFNFIGVVGEEDIEELKLFKQLARGNNSEYTIWFAHYPTSSIASPREGLRNIIDGPYLCGHFHTTGNIVMLMHATQQPGYAEVELGDWKYNRRIRLASIDHQLFNLIDFRFGEWPIALMTNPKKAEYSMPKFEPVDRMINSTHMRVIAFSNSSIESVKISIDGGQNRTLNHRDGPLWVARWTPNDYTTGLHSVRIYVQDAIGASRSFTQSFSLDHSKGEFPIGARILLRAYFRTYVMVMFYFIVAVCTLPLLFLRLIPCQYRESGLRRHYKGTFLYSFHLLSNIDSLMFPLFIVPVWMAIGPHFVGRLVDEAIGICFVWGIIIDKTFIHTGITFNVASVFLLIVHGTEVLLITYQVSSCYKAISRTKSPASILNLRMIIHVAVTALQLAMGSLLFSAYGTMALMTSFPFIWCIFIYAYCWYRCTKIGKSDFIKFDSRPHDAEQEAEQQALTGPRARDDKSSSSDHSTC